MLLKEEHPDIIKDLFKNIIKQDKENPHNIIIVNHSRDNLPPLHQMDNNDSINYKKNQDNHIYWTETFS